MSENNTIVIKRAAQMAAFTVGGGVALAFAMAGSASAGQVTGQGAGVVNAGVGIANSGGNVAVGNASHNDGGCVQGAVGVIANNSCGASNQSDGSASITTGNATAVGNESDTSISQSAGGGNGGGLAVTGQGAGVVNAGAGVANSGLNAAVGNASDNDGGCLQGAVGFVANNSCNASNSSDGSATIRTGNATAVGNQSRTTISQDANGGGGGGGLAVTLQGAGVANLGLGIANSGGNLAVGNHSDNDGGCGQLAIGFLANNSCNASNSSDGTASITTGDATAVGNRSRLTGIHQGADPDPGGLAVTLQAAPVLNAGLGIANSGLNADFGNISDNDAIVAQVAFGLLSNNVADPSNWSDGFAMILTGSATAVGNDSSTWIDQSS